MTELFKTLGTGNLGFGGLAVVIVILIVTGGLVPGNIHKRMLRDKDNQIEEWRKTHVADLERNREQATQITRLLDATRTTTHLIHSMQQEVSREIESIAIDTRANVDSQLYDRHALLQPAAPDSSQRRLQSAAAAPSRRDQPPKRRLQRDVEQQRPQRRSKQQRDEDSDSDSDDSYSYDYSRDHGTDYSAASSDDDSDGDSETDEMG